METLASPSMVNYSANKLIELYFDRWYREPIDYRIRKLSRVIAKILKKRNIPPPELKVDKTLHPCMEACADFEWYIRVNEQLFMATNKPDLWIIFMTAVYHEMRHIEQFWLFLLAIVNNTAPLPSKKGSNAIIQTPQSPEGTFTPNDTLVQKEKLLTQEGFPAWVINMAKASEYDITAQQAGLWMARFMSDTAFGRSIKEYNFRVGIPNRGRSPKSTVPEQEWRERRQYQSACHYKSQIDESDAFQTGLKMQNALTGMLAHEIHGGISIPPCITPKETEDPTESILCDLARLFDDSEHEIQ
ncbi:Uncharacterised protein [BD1-7 clade bacterium]|uniref:Uncharacterized protein n=1 Tax=BD1-7 clade bacterium TaxID=2029982 RepID=A0A5S9QYH8_9GAMM|nr:Uncharacterised protein [BD1-7 clade bacterium]